MSFPDSPDSKCVSQPQSKFRIVYVENCSNISSQKPLFTGAYAHLDEIKERLADFISSHPNVTIEYYNKKLGLRNRHILTDELPPNLEDIYVYLRSKKLMTCQVCEGRMEGRALEGDNHDHK